MTPQETLLKLNYLLIDFENVQPKKLILLRGHAFKVLVFVGAQQKSVPLKLAAALQSLGEDAEYLHISGNGKNALDFHIAFTIGRLSEEQPSACFHIISKDKGFDPLIAYAKKLKITIHRANDIPEMIQKITKAQHADDKVDTVVYDLAKRGTARPRKRATLKNTIGNIFKNALEDADLELVLKELITRGYVSIEEGKVRYHFPGST